MPAACTNTLSLPHTRPPPSSPHLVEPRGSRGPRAGSRGTLGGGAESGASRGRGRRKPRTPGSPGAGTQVRRGSARRGHRSGRCREGLGAEAPHPRPRLRPAPRTPTSPDSHLAKAEAAAAEPPRLPGLNPGKGGTEAARGGAWRLGPGPGGPGEGGSPRNVSPFPRQPRPCPVPVPTPPLLSTRVPSLKGISPWSGHAVQAPPGKPG